jgi:hypothetical protein
MTTEQLVQRVDSTPRGRPATAASVEEAVPRSRRRLGRRNLIAQRRHDARDRTDRYLDGSSAGTAVRDALVTFVAH